MLIYISNSLTTRTAHRTPLERDLRKRPRHYTLSAKVADFALLEKDVGILLHEYERLVRVEVCVPIHTHNTHTQHTHAHAHIHASETHAQSHTRTGTNVWKLAYIQKRNR